MIGKVTLLVFGGILFIAAIFLMTNDNNVGAIALLIPALILSLIGGVGPETLTKFVFEKKGDATKFSFDRNVDTPEKIEQALAVAKEAEAKADNRVKADLSEKSEALITQAKNTPEAKRSSSDYVLLASESWDDKDWIETIAYAKEGLRLEPENDKIAAELMNYIGMSLSELKSYPAADAWHHKAISRSPNYARAYNSLGVSLHEQKQYAEAQASYEKAIELDPDHARAHYNLGILLRNQKKYPEAEASYEKAIELDSNDANAYNNLGNVLKDQEKYSDAQTSYEKAIELDPNYAHAYNGLGNVLNRQNKYSEAQASYEKAIESDPNYAMAYSNLGSLHYRLKNFDEAETYYKKAIKLNPNNEKAKNNLKVLIEEKQNIAEVSD